MNKNEIEKNIQINTNLVRPRHFHRLHVPREKREEMKSKLHLNMEYQQLE
jgi:hypothetical protein